MKKMKRAFSILLALLLLLTCAAPVYAEESEQETDDRTLAPYFYVESEDTKVDTFPLKETKVTTNINGTIAETFVTQTYTNEGTSPLNARYVFPASTKVTVHGMKMTIGNQVITAQIKEREEAREEYEEAKSEGKSASLLEQQRPNVFTMDVANVMPGDNIAIELHYTEMITPSEGVYQFVFPTVTGPRYVNPNQETTPDSDQWTATPYLEDGRTAEGKYDIVVNLSTGVPITDMKCKSHSLNVDFSSETSAQLTLADPEHYAGDRDFILNYKLTGEELSSGLMLYTGEEENFFMLTVQPPERFASEDIPPREYIFVLDVSGSMYGYPLDTAKGLIKDLVSNLRKTDSFNLILFSSDIYQMSPQSLPATRKNIRAAMRLIDEQEGGGGTLLSTALESALATPANENMAKNIITITDGYISDEKNVFQIIHQNLNTTSFFSFGIGDAVNRYLIDGIAKAGQGESFVVTDSADAVETASRFRTYIEAPILTDINVSYDGFDVYDVEPAAASTLFAQKPVVLFGKWRGEPEGSIRLTGRTGKEEYQKNISVTGIQPLEANQAIRYLWARSRVERLTDYGCNTQTEDAVKQEITTLGLNYSMITPYTSFIAVTDVIRNTDGTGTDVDQPLPLPSNVSNFAVGGYTVGSEPADIILAALLAGMGIISLLYRKRRSAATKPKRTKC